LPAIMHGEKELWERWAWFCESPRLLQSH
jgi:hypothetical protein